MGRLACCAALALLIAAPALAEGPGTRIRSSSEIPRALERPLDRSAPIDDARFCDRLQGEARTRCEKQARKNAEADPATTGPGSSGMGSGAGSSSNSGTTGGGSFGASAPR